jgi:DNA-binding PadR family transcriptional regulator
MDVKTICLGVLCTREATGYDIKKHFETAFSHFFLAGFGSIYPALAELSDAGLVSCEEQSSGGRPGRKVYRATEAGQTTFLQALKETEPRHKVREVLDQRATEIEEMLAGVDQFEASQSELMSHGERFVSGYGRALLIAARDYLDHHRHLLEQCEQQGCGETADKALQATA